MGQDLRPRFHDVVTSDARCREFVSAGRWTADTMWSQLQKHAARQAKAIAVVDAEGTRHTSFGELHARALAVATFLRSRGIGPGDVVSMQLPNVMEAVAVAAGIQAAGCVINPVLCSYRTSELAFMFSKASPRAVFTPGVYRGFDHSEMVRELRSQEACPPFLHIAIGSAGGDVPLESVFATAPDPAAASAGALGAVSEVIFSSGTESSPKAVMHSEQTTNFAVRNLAEWLGLTSSDIVWMPSPVGHSTGFNYGLRLSVYLGLKLVLQDVWNGDVALDLVLGEQATLTLAATTFLQDLLDAMDNRQVAATSLRLFGCGGAPVPRDLVLRAQDHGVGVLRLYGSTEVLAATWNRPDAPLDRRVDTDGAVMPDVELSIRDDDGRPVADGTAGEIFVRSPSCSLGYFDDDTRTKETYDADGWVRSGDLGVLDDGYLTITGRKKEIVIRGGMNITPREIEDLLVAMPEVAKAAVVGLPDPRLGERACACLVLKQGATLTYSTLVSRLRAAGLASYKLPEAMHVLDSFPMTASGKVQKHLLIDEVIRAGGPSEVREG